MTTHNLASFDIQFTSPFCVVSRSGFKHQECATREEADAAVFNTLSESDVTAAIYGEGVRNRLALWHWRANDVPVLATEEAT